MSKQVVLLALAGMMLLALAMGAQTGDKAEMLKRHQSKYGAPKHSNVSMHIIMLREAVVSSGRCRRGAGCSRKRPTALRVR
jgi:hypothetical protein